MSLEETYIGILKRLPGVSDPLRRLTFNEKIKWTGIILILYFVMTQITVFGVGQQQYEQFQFLQILLGSTFGSLMSLGIGPIVTASIVLQLLVGSKIIPWDLKSENGKMLFQGTQKLLAILLSFIEGWAYVSFGAVPAAAPNFIGIVVLQLAMGGILVIFMDELISKWGFGSGVSLFIVGGVSKTILIRALNPLTQAGGFPTAGNPPAGLIPFSVFALGVGDITQAFFSMLPIFATLIVFFLVVYANSIKVEIPLAYGSIRGFGRRWPLKYFYTSNISVILIAALLANVQIFGRMLSSRGFTWLAELNAEGQITGGLLYYLTPPTTQAISGIMISIGLFAVIGAMLAYYIKRNGIKITFGFAIMGAILWVVFVYTTGLTSLLNIPVADMIRLLVYSSFMIIGATIFSIFWVYTSGMDAHSVAEQIQSTGMQIPGYRRDIRIIERVLNRYIPVLAVVGGASVGFLAAFADFTGALGTGTGILLSTMIVYQLYEELAMQHMEDMHPAFRRFIGRM